MKRKIALICFLIATTLICYKGIRSSKKLAQNTNDNTARDKFEVNSREYWDFRFKTQDWQGNKGDEQTLHFYTLLLNAIPEKLQEEMNEGKYTILDFGCAQGEGTEFFARMLPSTMVTGVDFSQEAIEIAKKKHNKAAFVADDLIAANSSVSKFDIVISSNTLEHFYEPWDVLYKLTNRANKSAIILVPFNQQGIPNEEHFYSFNYDNIPDVINGFKLSFKKILYPDPKFWGDKQILLIYDKAAP